MDEQRPRRILVYGVTGSGKTTLARQISERTGIPWYSVDDFTFEANWAEVDLEVQRARAREICSGESWILDTAYGKWIDVPLARAQLIVALDYPRWVSLTRLLRRTFGRIIDKRPVCNGNTESLRLALSRESILLWHFRSFASKRARIRNWQQDPPVPQIKVMRSQREVNIWLDKLPTAASPCPKPGAGPGSA